jgi:hypothetical protein
VPLLIGRALYLPEGSAADEEHRELAGVPEKVLFATRPTAQSGNIYIRASYDMAQAQSQAPE